MKDKLYVYYDEEGDFLEIHLGEYTKDFFRDIGNGISQCIDEKTGKVTGVAIQSFRKITAGPDELCVPLSTKSENSTKRTKVTA